MSAPGEAYGRAMALLLFAALVLLPLGFGVLNLQAASVARATNADQEFRLADITRRVAELRASGGLDRPAAAGAGLTFQGVTPAIAGAAMQRHVLQTIEAAGGRTVEARQLPVDDEAGVADRRVDLRVAFDARIAELQRILYDLETGVPVVLVRSIAVLTTGGIENEVDPVLRIDFLLAGYREAPLP